MLAVVLSLLALAANPESTSAHGESVQSDADEAAAKKLFAESMPPRAVR